ncbi:MAG TPA: DUF4129 domain-containing protein [Trebonia sp.]
MTARPQIARLLPLVLLVVLVIAGLHGTVPAPGWNGPLRAYGTVIGLVLEVILGVLLTLVLNRDGRARRADGTRPYDPEAGDSGLEPSQALRFTLKYVLAAVMIGVAVALLANLHLHFFVQPRSLPKPARPLVRPPRGPGPAGSGGSLHIPFGPILYGLLVVAIVAAVAVSIWWSARLRRPAVPRVTDDGGTEEDLRQAVRKGQAALARIDDARAAIIACYIAMERSLADRGTARTVADTPDELLRRAAAAGTVHGRAAGRLTALFYEARFSTHPVSAGQRDAARAALDELAAELSARPAPASGPAAPGGGPA